MITPGQPDSARNRRVLENILDVLSTRTPLIILAGPARIGRSTLLNQLAAALADRGVQAASVRSQPSPVSVPSQLVRALDRLPASDIVVLIDDAHELDQPSLSVLEDWIRRRARATGRRFVCTVRLPLARPALTEAFGRLREDGLTHQLMLPPLDDADIAEISAAALSARPHQDLVSRLRRLTGGRPGLLAAAIEQYQADDSIRIADDLAELTPRHRTPALDADDRLLRDVRLLGPLAWSVAKAISVLYPVGSAAAGLVAAALGTDELTVQRCLAQLRAARVLSRTPNGWYFRVPLLAYALTTHLGPFEKRRLAQHVVTALWHGDAHCRDPHYLADQLAIASRLVDPARSRSELLAHVAWARHDLSGRPERWLHAATALSTDPVERTRTLLALAAMALAHGHYEQTTLCVATIRQEPPGALTEAESAALDRLGILAAHAEGKAAEPEPTTGEPSGRSAVGRATALSLRDRWRAGAALLESTTSPTGYLLRAQAHLVTGRADLARRDLEAVTSSPAEAGNDVDSAGLALLTSILTEGADAAHTELTELPAPAEMVPLPVRALLAIRMGRFDEATALFNRATVGGLLAGHDVSHTLLYEAMADIRLGQGRLSDSRDLLHTARRTSPPLRSLLDGAQARIAQALSDPDAARRSLRHALDHATEHGLVIGTDRLWRQQAELELAAGDQPAAEHCRIEIDRLMASTPTRSGEVTSMVTRAVVRRDSDAARTALVLARDRNEPPELADVITTLVTHDIADPALLAEAYEILGGLDALLSRAWLRNLMRERGVTVPNRGRTVAENDRLLTALVADGLGNKQIAVVLRTSARSVESRLSRLFTRAGYRSRVELAVAMRSDLAGNATPITAPRSDHSAQQH